MSGYTRLDIIRNEVIREKVGDAPIGDKIRESRPRWFGHIKRRRNVNAPVRRCKTINLSRGKEVEDGRIKIGTRRLKRI